MKWLELAEQIIKDKKEPLSPSKIYKLAQKTELDKEIESDSKNPVPALRSALEYDIKTNSSSIFVRQSIDPVKYFLKELVPKYDKIETITNENIEDEVDTNDYVSNLLYDEKDLHPFLARFARLNFDCYVKTVVHNRSTKNEKAEWLHPDVIGFYYPTNAFENTTLEFCKAIGSTPLKLYSFEIKKSLTFSNLRESYFQAVSNSSWANEGYLVAEDIDPNEDFRLELRRLNSSFGIGVIEISIEDPDASEVIFPATIKNNIDWDTLNKLSRINDDVKCLLTSIKNTITINEVNESNFDRSLEINELLELIKKSNSMKQNKTVKKKNKAPKSVENSLIVVPGT